MSNIEHESEGLTKHHRDSQAESQQTPIRVSILTVSDSRTLDSDRSGQALIELLQPQAELVGRELIRDETTEIQHAVWRLCAISDAIVITGGTGLTARDQTPEAIEPLLDVALPGFGELFRWLSFQEIGPAAMLSRACAGRIGQTVVFVLPGSPAAVRLATERLILPELAHMVHLARQ